MKKAFTLAEVLVTLGIIGIVAALTVPNLVQNYQRQSYVTQLKKVYSELLQAVETAKNESNAKYLLEAESLRNGTFLQKSFKTVKSCSVSNLTDCFASEYFDLNDNSVSIGDYLNDDSECYVLASGAAICLGINVNAPAVYLTGIIDVNGKDGPNILDRDLFEFGIEDSGSTSAYGATLERIIQNGWVMTD